jgi:hypothetical protein
MRAFPALVLSTDLLALLEGRLVHLAARVLSRSRTFRGGRRKSRSSGIRIDKVLGLDGRYARGEDRGHDQLGG